MAVLRSWVHAHQRGWGRDGASSARCPIPCRQRGIEATPPKNCAPPWRTASARFDPNPFRSLLLAFTDDEDVIAFVRSSGRYPKELESPYPQARGLAGAACETMHKTRRHRQPVTSGTQETPGAVRTGALLRCVRVVGRSRHGEAGRRYISPRAGAERAASATESVMIGDRLDNDIRPAKALGFRTVRSPAGDRGDCSSRGMMQRRRMPPLRTLMSWRRCLALGLTWMRKINGIIASVCCAIIPFGLFSMEGI